MEHSKQEMMQLLDMQEKRLHITQMMQRLDQLEFQFV